MVVLFSLLLLCEFQRVTSVDLLYTFATHSFDGHDDSDNNNEMKERAKGDENNLFAPTANRLQLIEINSVLFVTLLRCMRLIEMT